MQTEIDEKLKSREVCSLGEMPAALRPCWFLPG